MDLWTGPPDSVVNAGVKALYIPCGGGGGAENDLKSHVFEAETVPVSPVVAMLGMLSPSSRGALMTTACFLFMFMG